MEGATAIAAQDTLEKTAAQIQEVITSHLSWDAREVFVNEEI